MPQREASGSKNKAPGTHAAHPGPIAQRNQAALGLRDLRPLVTDFDAEITFCC